MNEITMKRVEDKIEVRFPRELKDNFKETFPSARWAPGITAWTVGVRTQKRVESWIKAVTESGIVDELQSIEERELSAAELAKLEAEIARLRAARQADAERLKTQKELLDDIAARRAELDEAAAEAKRVADELETARQAVLEEVARHVDVQKIESLRNEMRYAWSALKSANRDRFERAQKALREIDDKLEEVGIMSRALRLAVNANWNRPDRDRADLNVALVFKKIDE